MIIIYFCYTEENKLILLADKKSINFINFINLKTFKCIIEAEILKCAVILATIFHKIMFITIKFEHIILVSGSANNICTDADTGQKSDIRLFNAMQ